MPEHNSRPFSSAVLIIILAIFLFDVQGAMIKHMGKSYPVEQIAVFRNLFGILPNLLVLLFFFRRTAPGKNWIIRQWKLGLGRGLMLVCAQLSFYFSLLHMELATATTLAFAGPLFVTLLSVPMLGHRVGSWRIAAVMLGFSGVVLVLRPGGESFTVLAILPVTAAFFYAVSSLTTRYFDQQVPTALIGIYASVGAAAASSVVLIALNSWQAMDSISVWLWFIGMGTVGGCAVLCLISAYRMADPSSLSPFEYFGIPFSFVLGWVFFNETPFQALFPGVFLIVAGGLIVFWREKKLTP